MIGEVMLVVFITVEQSGGRSGGKVGDRLLVVLITVEQSGGRSGGNVGDSLLARSQNCENQLLPSSCLSVRLSAWTTQLPLDGFS